MPELAMVLVRRLAWRGERFSGSVLRAIRTARAGKQRGSHGWTAAGARYRAALRLARVCLESAARAVSRARLHAILLTGVRYDLDVDLAEPFVRIRLRIISHRVGIPQILADRLKRFHLFLPITGEVRFAARACRDALKHIGGN